MRLNYALQTISVYSTTKIIFSRLTLPRTRRPHGRGASGERQMHRGSEPYTRVQSGAMSHTVVGRPSFRFTALIIKS